MWHKADRRRRPMVQSYSPGGSNVSCHEGTLAPPGEYDWAYASFGHWSPQPKRQIDRFRRFCTVHGIKCIYFTMGAPIHQNCPFPHGIWTPSNGWCLGRMRAHIPNGTSIGSAMIAHMTAECPYTLQRFARFPFKIAPSMEGSEPHVISLHSSLGPPDFWTQTTTRSLRPFCRAL